MVTPLLQWAIQPFRIAINAVTNNPAKKNPLHISEGMPKMDLKSAVMIERNSVNAMDEGVTHELFACMCCRFSLSTNFAFALSIRMRSFEMFFDTVMPCSNSLCKLSRKLPLALACIVPTARGCLFLFDFLLIVFLFAVNTIQKSEHAKRMMADKSTV